MVNDILKPFFGNPVKWMYSGIEATMTKKETYHTCALALSTYTEIMGGLVTGKLKKVGETRNNYDAFIPYLGQKYVDLDNKMKSDYPVRLKYLYSAVRSKLVHEFSLRESHFIVNVDNPCDDKIGIELWTQKTETVEMIHINFRIAEYYRDFKNGVTTYYNKLKQGEKYQELLDKFVKATDENYPSEKLNDNFKNNS